MSSSSTPHEMSPSICCISSFSWQHVKAVYADEVCYMLVKSFSHHVPNSAHLVRAQRGFTEIFAVFAAQAVYHLSKAGGWNLFVFLFQHTGYQAGRHEESQVVFQKHKFRKKFLHHKMKNKKMYKISNTSSRPMKTVNAAELTEWKGIYI